MTYVECTDGECCWLSEEGKCTCSHIKLARVGNKRTKGLLRCADFKIIEGVPA